MSSANCHEQSNSVAEDHLYSVRVKRNFEPASLFFSESQHVSEQQASSSFGFTHML